MRRVSIRRWSGDGPGAAAREVVEAEDQGRKFGEPLMDVRTGECQPKTFQLESDTHSKETRKDQDPHGEESLKCTTLRAEIERRIAPARELSGFSPQTLTNIIKALAAIPDLPGRKEALEQIEQDCRDIQSRRRRGVRDPWAWIVSRLQYWNPSVRIGHTPAVLEELTVVESNVEVVASLREQVRLEYSPDEIANDPLEPSSAFGAYTEAELDEQRASQSPAHADAVRRRWQVLMPADVVIPGKLFLSKEWTNDWWFDFKVPSICSPTRPMSAGSEISQIASAAS